MATQQEIELVWNRLQDVHPEQFFKTIDEGNAGVGAVLKYLHEAHDSVTAGSISEYCGVSTARVAVLLRKMTAQNLIIKHGNAKDARVMMIRLSPKGEEKAKKMKLHAYEEIGAVIDRIGMDKFNEFITILNEIRQTIDMIPMEE